MLGLANAAGMSVIGLLLVLAVRRHAGPAALAGLGRATAAGVLAAGWPALAGWAVVRRRAAAAAPPRRARQPPAGHAGRCAWWRCSPRWPTRSTAATSGPLAATLGRRRTDCAGGGRRPQPGAASGGRGSR